MTAFFNVHLLNFTSKMTRKPIKLDTQTDVLLKCKRKCAMCFGLHENTAVVDGQIAHLDRNHGNDDLDNLAFLCLYHHNQYDTVPSQTKKWTIGEVKAYRDRLHTYCERQTVVSESMNIPVAQASAFEINKIDTFLHKYAELFSYIFSKREDLAHSIDVFYITQLSELHDAPVVERVRTEPITTHQENLWRALSNLLGVYGEYQDYMCDDNRIRFDNKHSSQEILRKNKQKMKEFVEIIEQCHSELDEIVSQYKK